MAEFCRDCLKKVMGINPDTHPEWLVSDGGICEECGYDYLNKPDMTDWDYPKAELVGIEEKKGDER